MESPDLVKKLRHMDTQPYEDVKYDLNGTNMGLISIVTRVKLYDISTAV